MRVCVCVCVYPSKPLSTVQRNIITLQNNVLMLRRLNAPSTPPLHSPPSSNTSGTSDYISNAQERVSPQVENRRNDMLMQFKIHVWSRHNGPRC